MPGDLPLRVSPDVVTQDLGDGLVLLNLRSGIYWSLNRTGAVIWRGVENRAGIDTICQQLREEFEGTDDALPTAVHSLLSELIAERLILEATPADPETPQSAHRAGRPSPRMKPSAAANSAAKPDARNGQAGKKFSRKLPKR